MYGLANNFNLVIPHHSPVQNQPTNLIIDCYQYHMCAFSISHILLKVITHQIGLEVRPWEHGCHPKLTSNSSKQTGDYMREITYMASSCSSILPPTRPFLVSACRWRSSQGRCQPMLLRWRRQRERRRGYKSRYERHWSEMLNTNGNLSSVQISFTS